MLRKLGLALFFVALGSIGAKAADFSGKWYAEFDTQIGVQKYTYEFHVDGAKLTGTVTGPQGDPLAIDNGKIDGDKFSFTVSFNNTTITHEGTINGDEIKMSTKSDNGGMPPMDMTLKRSTDAPK